MKTFQRLSPVAAAAALLVAALPAGAFEAIDLGDGLTLQTRINLTYTLTKRMKDIDQALATSAGNNDGDNNFAKGALTANRLGALLDAKLTKDGSGLVLSASTFYDNVYHRSNDNNPDPSNPNKVNRAPPYNEFSDQARHYHGGYSRILDAYGYTAFDLGSSRLNLRLGRQVVSWGEALFFPGISLAQGPADGTKTGVPGTETKDQLLPEDQISVALEVNPRWTLLGHWQFNFHPTLAPAPGSFMNSSDGVGPGGVCLQNWTTVAPIAAVGFPGYTGCAFGNVGDDILPRKTGQWGLGTRYRITDETEVGVYYLNYSDRTPLPEINAFTPGPFAASPVAALRPLGSGSYRVRYFDNVKLLGGTFSTTLTKQVILAGELSYKKGAPVLVDTPLSATSSLPNPTRANITQFNINAFGNFGRTPVAESTLLLGELAAIRIGGIDARQAPGAENLPAAFQPPASNKPTFQTRHALAASVTATLGYPGIFENWDLTVPISYSQQIKGRTLVGGVGGQGDRRYSIGATFVYGGNLSLGLTYLGFLGDPDPNGSSKTFIPFTDRNTLSFIAKYSF